jgi:Family of unknown function (DUF6481)
MSAFKKSDDFSERLSTAAKAKQASLEKFRARPRADDPAVAEQQAARLATTRRATSAGQREQPRPSACSRKRFVKPLRRRCERPQRKPSRRLTKSPCKASARPPATPVTPRAKRGSADRSHAARTVAPAVRRAERPGCLRHRRGTKEYGLHLSGVTSSGFPFLELIQPAPVRLHGHLIVYGLPRPSVTCSVTSSSNGALSIGFQPSSGGPRIEHFLGWRRRSASEAPVRTTASARIDSGAPPAPSAPALTSTQWRREGRRGAAEAGHHSPS